jgi:superfamily II helicase
METKILTQEEKIKKLCDKITAETQKRLSADGLGCECNYKNAIAHSKDGKKYIKIDVGTSGKYMIEKETGNIYGIKAYGQIHKGHFFGTLDTIDGYFWGDYRAVKI